MKIFLKILPYFYAVLLAVLLYWEQEYRDWLWYFTAVLIFFFLIVWWALVQKKNFSKEQLVIFLSPLFYLLSSLAFYILTDSVLLQRLLIFLVVVGLFVFFRALYFFHWRSVKYQPGTLQIQIRYMNIISIFLLSSFLYSLETFLHISLWLVGLIMLLFLEFIQWQHLYLKHKLAQERLYSLIFILMATEYFLAIGFLPFLILVKGFLFLVGYYVFYELFKGTVKGLWRKQEVITLISGGAMTFIIILLITKWF